MQSTGGNTTKLAAEYLISRDAIYRHAHALGLMEKRRRNLRAALEKIIEEAGEVKVNAAAVVSAVSALARINSQGQWVERTETVSLNAAHQAEQQVVKALRSLPWYMFLVPALLTLLMLLFDPLVVNDTRPEFGYWAMMWIVSKLGFFVWVLRQLLRYALVHWMTQLRRAISYSPPNNVRPVTHPRNGKRNRNLARTIPVTSTGQCGGKREK
jgi:hypothetical protein